ncbi:MAG: TetR/AcrR family transcriptional regulator [Actinobacteria bacterium]|nr:TetR/AcrR family transcriptional regulator [Actinomycetota bacterium]
MGESPAIEGAPGAGRGGRARTRAALLASGRRLIAERGMAGTTIADVAAGADLGFGTFYLYFQSKEELLATIVADGMAELDRVLTEATRGVAGPLERQRAAVRAYLAFAHGNTDLFRVMFEAAPSWAHLVEATQGPFLRRVEAVLREGMAEGVVRDGPVELMANMVLACVRWAGLWWATHDEPPPQAVAEEVITFLERGIGAPGS